MAAVTLRMIDVIKLDAALSAAMDALSTNYKLWDQLSYARAHLRAHFDMPVKVEVIDQPNRIDAASAVFESAL
jgi:hypothetical protein